jgi:hypothetical protein
MTEHELAKEWLDRPEHDIGFELHKHDDCGPTKAIIDPACERCAVELALAAYAVYRGSTT